MKIAIAASLVVSAAAFSQVRYLHVASFVARNVESLSGKKCCPVGPTVVDYPLATAAKTFVPIRSAFDIKLVRLSHHGVLRSCRSVFFLVFALM